MNAAVAAAKAATNGLASVVRKPVNALTDQFSAAATQPVQTLKEELLTDKVLENAVVLGFRDLFKKLASDEATMTAFRNALAKRIDALLNPPLPSAADAAAPPAPDDESSVAAGSDSGSGSGGNASSVQEAAAVVDDSSISEKDFRAIVTADAGLNSTLDVYARITVDLADSLRPKDYDPSDAAATSTENDVSDVASDAATASDADGAASDAGSGAGSDTGSGAGSASSVKSEEQRRESIVDDDAAVLKRQRAEHDKLVMYMMRTRDIVNEYLSRIGLGAPAPAPAPAAADAAPEQQTEDREEEEEKEELNEDADLDNAGLPKPGKGAGTPLRPPRTGGGGGGRTRRRKRASHAAPSGDDSSERRVRRRIVAGPRRSTARRRQLPRRPRA